MVSEAGRGQALLPTPAPSPAGFLTMTRAFFSHLLLSVSHGISSAFLGNLPWPDTFLCQEVSLGISF